MWTARRVPREEKLRLGVRGVEGVGNGETGSGMGGMVGGGTDIVVAIEG